MLEGMTWDFGEVVPSSMPLVLRYDCGMPNKKDHKEVPPELEQYLALCQRIYERMEREGSWPWFDSTDAEDLVDSVGNPFDV